VHEVQIDVVETSRPGSSGTPSLPEGFKGKSFVVTRSPLVGRRSSDRVADATLVPIEPCGVNVSDTDSSAQWTASCTGLRRDLPHAKAEHRDARHPKVTP